MSFKKNTAVTGFPFALVSATDGSPITTGTVTGYVTLDGGTQATIAGSATHEGNGQWSINLTAGEMNGDIVGLLFTHASAINVHFTIKTDTKIVSDLNDVAATDIVSSGAITTSGGAVSTVSTLTGHTPQTGDTFAQLPTNFSDLAITASTGRITVGTNNDKSGYSISGTITTLDGLNNLSTAQVKTQVDTALTDIHLDHLFAVDYDPTSKPGNAGAWANEMVENNGSGGVRYTVDALSQAPGGGGGSDWSTAEKNQIRSALGVDGTKVTATGGQLQDKSEFDPATDAVANVTLVDTTTTNTDMRGTDGASTFNAATDTVDVGKINGSTAAASDLAASAETIVQAAAVTGTLSTTEMTTNLTETTDDHYNGRIIIWTSGGLTDQATNITDYDGASKKLTFTAITEAPGNGDTFVIV